MNPLQAELDALLAEYRRDLPQRVAHIDALATRGGLLELRRALHTLAGSAGTFGLPRVGDAARRAEQYLADRREGGDPAELERLLQDLRHAACSP